MSNRNAHLDAISPDMIRVLRAKTGAERLAIASGMYASARRMLLSHLRSLHPDWDAQTIAREAARRLSHGSEG